MFKYIKKLICYFLPKKDVYNVIDYQSEQRDRYGCLSVNIYYRIEHLKVPIRLGKLLGDTYRVVEVFRYVNSDWFSETTGFKVSYERWRMCHFLDALIQKHKFQLEEKKYEPLQIQTENIKSRGRSSELY